MTTKPKKKHSAGGIVAARIDGQLKLLLIKNSFDKLWAIPKGHLDPGETSEQAAIREIAEETGLRVTAAEKLGQNKYTFRGDALGRAFGTRDHVYDKTVDVYLLKLVGDPALDPAKFDPDEGLVADARWFNPKEAVTAIGYANLRTLVAKAAGRAEAYV